MHVLEKSPSVFASGYQIPAPPPPALDRSLLRAQAPGRKSTTSATIVRMATSGRAGPVVIFL